MIYYKNKDSSELIEKSLEKTIYEGVPQFRMQISSFVDAVLGKHDNLVSSIDGAKTVAVCRAAIESVSTGNPVRVSYDF